MYLIYDDAINLIEMLAEVGKGRSLTLDEESYLLEVTDLDFSGTLFNVQPERDVDTSIFHAYTYLSEIPREISLLKNLRRLRLPNSGLLSLPKEIGQLDNLEELEFGCNHYIYIPFEITGLKNIKKINMSLLYLKEIPEFLLDLGLPFTDAPYHSISYGISIWGIYLENQPSSIFLQDSSLIKSYYRQQSMSVYESKVFFLGDGASGKTTTINRILNDNYFTNDSTKITHGIQISEKQFIYNEQEIKLHFWDFGGQEIMHSMHQCFMVDRA